MTKLLHPRDEIPKGSGFVEELSPDVISRAKAGERRALDQLLRACSGFVASTLYKLIGPTSDLDDLHQTVLMRVLTNIATFRREALLKTWVSRICVQTVAEHFRLTKSRLRHQAGSAVVSSVTHGGVAPSVERSVEMRERWAKLLRVLDALSPNHRTAVLLKNMGHSVEEIAEMMGAARSTTRLRLYYGRKALATAIAAAFADEELP